MTKMLPEYKYIILAEAAKDFEMAICWYKAINNTLSECFRASFREAAAKIKAVPFACAIRFADIRVCRLKGFPYVIHYRIDKEEAICFITGIYHERSNPEKWLSHSLG